MKHIYFTKDGYLEKLYAYVTREVNAVKEASVDELKKLLPEEKVKQTSSGKYIKMEIKPKFKKNSPKKMPETCPHCGGTIKEFDWGYTCNKCTAKVGKKVGLSVIIDNENDYIKNNVNQGPLAKIDLISKMEIPKENPSIYKENIYDAAGYDAQIITDLRQGLLFSHRL